MKKPEINQIIDNNYNEITGEALETLLGISETDNSWGSYGRDSSGVKRWTSTFVFTGKVIRLFILSMYLKLVNVDNEINNQESGLKKKLSDAESAIQLVLDDALQISKSNNLITITDKDNNLFIMESAGTISFDAYLFGDSSESVPAKAQWPSNKHITSIKETLILSNLTLQNNNYKIFYLTVKNHTLQYAKTSNNEVWAVGNNEIINTANAVDGYNVYKMQFDSAPSTLLKVTFYFN